MAPTEETPLHNKTHVRRMSLALRVWGEIGMHLLRLQRHPLNKRKLFFHKGLHAWLMPIKLAVM